MRTVLLLVLVVAVVTACGQDTESPGQADVTPPGTRKMRDALRDIARRTPDENYFTGSFLARRLREQLKGVSPTADPARRLELLRKAGGEELRVGNVQWALDHYREARALLGAARASKEVRAHLLYDTGIAWMQLAERQNCCHFDAPEACILPIRGDAVHVHRQGSTEAAKCFAAVMQLLPASDRKHRGARWLLNVAHMTLGTWPDGVPASARIPAEALRSDVEIPRFENVAKQAGLRVYDLAGGAVVEDFDGDGDLDILTTSWDPTGPMKYFRNQGDGTFALRTREAGLEGLLGGLNMKQADFDNDGDTDVLVLRGAWLADRGQHPNSLLRNDGTGRFEDVTFAAGLGDVHYPTQTAAWADFDRDGHLDLYVGNETQGGLHAACQLFRNRGDGTFVDVAEQAGVRNERFTKGVTWGDFDDDGDPDLYVSNYRQPNRLYRNDDDGTFRDVAAEVGVITPTYSFPVWFWDFDNDGVLDLYVPSYAANVGDVADHYLGRAPKFEASRLFRGTGAGAFEDVAASRGLVHPVLPMGSNYGDLDGDGFPDFYLGTGDPEFESLMPNLMFLNQAGQRFADVTIAGGFGHLQKGHAISFADLDHDGDIDVFSQLGGAYAGDKYKNALYENPGFGHRWLTLRLEGRTANRSAIGARIRVVVRTDDGERSVYRHVDGGGSFGANPLRQTIGLGKATGIVRVEIRWPSRTPPQVVEGLALDRAYHLVQGAPTPQPMAYPVVKLGGAR